MTTAPTLSAMAIAAVTANSEIHMAFSSWWRFLARGKLADNALA